MSLANCGTAPGMNDNEKLIEEARAAFTEAWRAEDKRAGLRVLAREPVQPHSRSRAGIIAALAVFEKAHTSSDDEREALARAQWDTPVNVITWGELTEMAESGDGDYRETRDYALAAAGRGIAAGFRRSVVPEASAECTCANTLGWHTTDCPANRNKIAEPETSEAHAYSRGFWAGVRSEASEPQGEPSDAQVLARGFREGVDFIDDQPGPWGAGMVAGRAEAARRVAAARAAGGAR